MRIGATLLISASVTITILADKKYLTPIFLVGFSFELIELVLMWTNWYLKGKTNE